MTVKLRIAALGTERIRRIVLSLRNFSRMDEAAFKAVDLHEGIESTLLLLQHRFKEKSDRAGIEIVRKYGDLPPVECYPSQVNQALMNLLANAIDALEEANSQRSPQQPGQIVIQTTVLPGDRVQIEITDNGIGMTPAVRDRIFNPFFTTKSVGKGTGMGMSIVYQIVVEKHGGQLDCVSAPGEGTRFILRLPRYQSVAIATAAQPTPAST